MTNKHFIALADKILADVCASMNPNFNRQLWLDYIAGKCGPSGGKLKS